MRHISINVNNTFFSFNPKTLNFVIQNGAKSENTIANSIFSSQFELLYKIFNNEIRYFTLINGDIYFYSMVFKKHEVSQLKDIINEINDYKIGVL